MGCGRTFLSSLRIIHKPQFDAWQPFIFLREQVRYPANLTGAYASDWQKETNLRRGSVFIPSPPAGRTTEEEFGENLVWFRAKNLWQREALVSGEAISTLGERSPSAIAGSIVRASRLRMKVGNCLCPIRLRGEPPHSLWIFGIERVLLEAILSGAKAEEQGKWRSRCELFRPRQRWLRPQYLFIMQNDREAKRDLARTIVVN